MAYSDTCNLRHQPGFLPRHLVTLRDGTYLDLLFATSQQSVWDICNGWRGPPQCEAFLALIEPESVTFANVLESCGKDHHAGGAARARKNGHPRG